MTKYIFIFLLSLFYSLTVSAVSTGGTVYNFLTLPTSSTASGLGGTNISLHNGDLQMASQNPAMLSAAKNKSVALTYFNYIEDVQYANLSYGQAIDSLSWWGVGYTYLNYGSFDSYDEFDQSLGTFSASDMCLSAIYARKLASNFVVGLSLKPVYSFIDNYNSFGLAIDLGANYFLKDKDFSASFALRNFGVQFTAYDEERQTLPWDMQIGVSKKLAHAPFRISATYVKLNQWNLDFVKDGELYDMTTDIKSSYDRDVTWGSMFFRHMIFGLEFLPSDNFCLMVGYNYRRHAEYKVADLRGGSGFSFGGAFHIYKFDLGISYALCGPSGGIFGLSLASRLTDFKK